MRKRLYFIIKLISLLIIFVLLKNNRLFEVNRFFATVVFDADIGIEKIKSQRIGIRVYFLNQSFAQKRPLGFSDAAFKNRVLNSLTVILASAGDAAQPAAAGFVNGRNVVGNED